MMFVSMLLGSFVCGIGFTAGVFLVYKISKALFTDVFGQF